jgi:uncharacterized protein YfaT (DUF1175 family)
MTPHLNQSAGERRAWLKQTTLSLALSALSRTALADPRRLDRAQTAAFRAWFVTLVADQVMRPSPRWVHRDCAGLVRFAVNEALKSHDARWRHAMGWSSEQPSPPDVVLQPDQLDLQALWHTADGKTSAYASALAMVQLNTRFVGKSRTRALPGDLLFFDQGDEQHLMVWTGRAVAYHNGAAPQPTDNGLRWQPWERLQSWSDTRWRPSEHNPNFAGLFRLAFLADAG